LVGSAYFKVVRINPYKVSHRLATLDRARSHAA
jgi:hypothetical protein